ncbi:hypothetical protein BpHYR1_009031 [Brachionus plicatilis]|uniref:Uncharacterized protein n=1 Tax=Brachionus plicatilis TaxID=10195 RepID=A0A3M7R356_BRAPC|nr:hypothetical protein BpHYR1_009031 [Brachionus plicatilis]
MFAENNICSQRRIYVRKNYVRRQKYVRTYMRSKSYKNLNSVNFVPFDLCEHSSTLVNIMLRTCCLRT